eukprot:02573.XXX_1784_1930_1 [CDS] Oithona nana genome sequencing.
MVTIFLLIGKFLRTILTLFEGFHFQRVWFGNQYGFLSINFGSDVVNGV